MPDVHAVKIGMVVYLELTSSKTFIDKYIYVHPKKERGILKDFLKYYRVNKSS